MTVNNSSQGNTSPEAISWTSDKSLDKFQKPGLTGGVAPITERKGTHELEQSDLPPWSPLPCTPTLLPPTVSPLGCHPVGDQLQV